jgi:hypothetical protein
MKACQFWPLVLLSVVAVGCQTKGPDGSVRRYYFGYTVVTIPKAAPDRPDFCVREVSNVGLAIGGGDLGFGYNKTKNVVLPPDGAIYLEVVTDEQFNKARELIELCNQAGLCVTKKTTKKAAADAKP